MKVSTLFVASLLAFLLSVAVFARVWFYTEEFDEVVENARITSEGYDQAFIDMVNSLEDELEQRASFGYVGEKDPMTGMERKIVKPKPVVKTRRYRTRKRVAPKEVADPFRLSAIIYDERQEKFAAIIMIGERSRAVEVKDYVEGRTIRSINKSTLVMTDKEYRYTYDIEGNSVKAKISTSN